MCGFLKSDHETPGPFNVLQANTNELHVGDERWSEAIAVGSLVSVGMIESDLGVKGRSREVIEADGSYALREATACSE